ncbi:Sugar transport protein 13 [Apostasia shenzhenica]|uniref:Sugar transport protein 13 n=1 Tax=Apostasia shenzhenica TaxID=1088818 RepID=A0A2I0A2T5_9ASPA|nr:Sugar transport protein 13 [Apostasia shenzhenica]
MPAGGFSVAAPAGTEFEAKITPVVIISCIMAATGGLMFGYDNGVTGGVTSMNDFLKKFFPNVYRKKNEPGLESNYCKYDNQGLQLFTSSLYLAGLIATFFASYTTRRLGRRRTMLIAGLFFIAGVTVNGAAQDLAMLIIGRILLGCGVGFANQAVPLFLSEIAPTRIRGGLNILFQLNVTIGILFANLINYGTSKIHPWGWRLSLGLAGIPALLLTAGALTVVDTPNSLIERGRLDEGRAVLKKIRGTDNVGAEFEEILAASLASQQVKHPFRNLLKRRNRPQLVISAFLQLFQQFTGINAIMFYSPVLFNTLGFKSDASLYSAVITGAVNVLSTTVSIYSVDRVGRRALLLEAGVQMFLAQVVIAVVLGIKVTDHSDNLGTGWAVLVVLMVCVFVSAFAWSWGPLGWLIPSETFQLETRSAGQSVTVCTNLLFTFVIAQAFLSMLCHMKYGIFAFFSGWILIMSLFVFFLLPETKNVPIEEMTERVWKQHWFWRRFIEEDHHEEDEKKVAGNGAASNGAADKGHIGKSAVSVVSDLTAQYKTAFHLSSTRKAELRVAKNVVLLLLLWLSISSSRWGFGAMGRGNAGGLWIVAFAIAAVAGLASSAAVYNVGGGAGWIVAENYSSWASSKIFHVGDKIVFEYDNSSHNVLEVRKEDYHSCNAKSPIAAHATGNDSISLTRYGHRFFICGFPGHCAGGQKLDVRVQKHRLAIPPSGGGSAAAPASSGSAAPTGSDTASAPVGQTPHGVGAAEAFGGIGSAIAAGAFAAAAVVLLC